MPIFSRSAAGRIAGPLAALCAAFGAVPAPAQDAAAWRETAGMERLVPELERWLDRNSPYPARRAPVAVRQVSAENAGGVLLHAARPGPRTRGQYDAGTATIFLIEPWSPHDPHDVSVLLHELVHHRQQTARHWYCPGQQELPAYRLQEAWLRERGETGRINWIAATLESVCARADIHPD